MYCASNLKLYAYLGSPRATDNILFPEGCTIEYLYMETGEGQLHVKKI